MSALTASTSLVLPLFPLSSSLPNLQMISSPYPNILNTLWISFYFDMNDVFSIFKRYEDVIIYTSSVLPI